MSSGSQEDAIRNGKILSGRGGRRLLPHLYWSLAVFGALAIGLLVGANRQSSPFAAIENRSSMNDCVANTLTLLKLTEPPTTAIIKESTEHCYSLLRLQGLLNTYEIWELNYVQQYRANGVLLWLVVAITLSGVMLAAIQLVTSYRLAIAGRSDLSAEGQLTLKRGEIALKSSIAGLFILLLSFAFFLVFVQFVYRFDIPKDDVDWRPDLKNIPVVPGPATLDSTPAPKTHH